MARKLSSQPFSQAAYEGSIPFARSSLRRFAGSTDEQAQQGKF